MSFTVLRGKNFFGPVVYIKIYRISNLYVRKIRCIPWDSNNVYKIRNDYQNWSTQFLNTVYIIKSLIKRSFTCLLIGHYLVLSVSCHSPKRSSVRLRRVSVRFDLSLLHPWPVSLDTQDGVRNDPFLRVAYQDVNVVVWFGYDGKTFVSFVLPVIITELRLIIPSCSTLPLSDLLLAV